VGSPLLLDDLVASRGRPGHVVELGHLAVPVDVPLPAAPFARQVPNGDKMVRPEAVARPAATANDVQRPDECLGDEILLVGDFGAISPGDPPNAFGVPPKQLAERRRRDFVEAALRAIADHAVEQITAELAPLRNLHGSPLEMISSAINSHTTWLAEHNHLHRYLTMHSNTVCGGRDVITDVKTVIARHLTLLIEHYLTVFGIDTRVAQPVDYGVVRNGRIRHRSVAGGFPRLVAC
jgi:hypothetical protein